MKTLLIHPVRGKDVEITPAAGTITTWKNRKCWSVMCANPVWFVHLGKTGRADIGYCYCCFNWRVFEYYAKGIKELGSWHMVEDGKLTKYVFDPVEKRIRPAGKDE